MTKKIAKTAKPTSKPVNRTLQKIFERVDKCKTPQEKGLYVYSYPKYAKEILKYILETTPDSAFGM